MRTTTRTIASTAKEQVHDADEDVAKTRSCQFPFIYFRQRPSAENNDDDEDDDDDDQNSRYIKLLSIN